MSTCRCRRHSAVQRCGSPPRADVHIGFWKFGNRVHRGSLQFAFSRVSRGGVDAGASGDSAFDLLARCSSCWWWFGQSSRFHFVSALENQKGRRGNPTACERSSNVATSMLSRGVGRGDRSTASRRCPCDSAQWAQRCRAPGAEWLRRGGSRERRHRPARPSALLPGAPCRSSSSPSGLSPSSHRVPVQSLGNQTRRCCVKKVSSPDGWTSVTRGRKLGQTGELDRME